MAQLVDTKVLASIGDQAIEWDRLIRAAGQDPYLDAGDGELRTSRSRMAIVEDRKIVGFISPFEQPYQGKQHYRAGSLFILPEYRGRGIMREVLQEYFANRQPGLTWIDDTNLPSIKLFTSLGFVQQGAHKGLEGKVGHWYVLDSQTRFTAALEAFPSWRRW